MKRERRFYCGTSGFSYSSWKKIFYPEKLPSKRWLEHYASKLNTVEINLSFYRLPSEELIGSWKKRVPSGFKFTFKMWRRITHEKRLEDVEVDIRIFLQRVRRMGRKVGCILIQLPPSMNCTPDLLENFLRILPDRFKYAVEFRHASWFEDDIYDILSKHGVAFCIFHGPKLVSPVVTTSSFAYMRFHGTTGQCRGSYAKYMIEWKKHIEGFPAKVKEVYAYFNNDIEGDAPIDAMKLFRLVGRRI